MVEREVLQFLQSEDPEVLCLSGAWGIGKTWLWNGLLTQAQAKTKIGLKSYAYISLFGIQSIDDLKTAIFENTVPTAALIQEPSLDTFSDNILQALQPAGRKALSGIVDTFFKSASGGVRTLSHFSISSTIICLDDLERKGEKLRVIDILGLASSLRERRKCKIAIILNSEQLIGDEKAAFDRYHEKVIDTSITFAPTAGDCASIAINTAKGLEIALVERVKALNVTNIRVIRKIQRLLRQVEPLASKYHANVSNQIVSTLALFGWLHFSRTSDPTSGLMDFAMNKRGQVIFDEEKKFTDEEIRWNTFLDRYGFTATDELDLVILEGIRAGFFNTAQLTELSEKLDTAARNMQALANLERAWSLFHDSLALDTDTVVQGILSAFKQNLQAANITNLDATVRTFKELERPDEAAEALEYFLQNKQGGPKTFDLSSFAFRNHVSDPDVIAGLKARILSIQTLPTPDEVLEGMVATNSWSIVGIEVLSHLTIDEFVALFKRLDGSVLRETIESLRGIESMDLKDKRYAQISESTRQALLRIAEESKLNAIRLRSFGFAPPPPSQPTTPTRKRSEG